MTPESTRSAGETDGAASIVIDGVSKTFETEQAPELVFEDLDLQIGAGTFTTLVGRSGSGKSTLLSIVSGVEEPTEGDVRFESGDGETNVSIGHVFQEPRLLPWNTCLKNIELVHEGNPDYSEAVGKHYLDMVGLDGHYDKYPNQLSGGQRQRVGIARALSLDPEVLLMDEPFSNLDELTAENLRDEMIDIWQDLNKTILFVTHDITEAVQLSDRILMLGNGHIYGDVEVTLERPRDLTSDEFLRFRQRTIDTFNEVEQ